MTANLRRIGLITFVGPATIAGRPLPHVQAANLLSQELKKGNIEPEYFQVPRDQAAMYSAGLQGDPSHPNQHRGDR